MKTLLVSGWLLIGNLSIAAAQVNVPPAPSADRGNAIQDLPVASAPKVPFLDSLALTRSFAAHPAEASELFSVPPLARALGVEGGLADPAAPSPEPKFLYGGRDDYRWQVNLSFTWFRFQSNAFDSNEYGIKTTVSYFLNDWFGVEGGVTAAFGSPPFNNGQDAKIATYGGGPKIAWRQKRWEPWLHGIFGGAHEQPQTSTGSRSTYSITAGGGADYRWNPRISFRAEADYVHTGFFNQAQHNFQLAGGIVFHF